MTVLINTFEEGVNGVSISTSNSSNATDNPWDTASITGGGILRYSGLYQAHGTMSAVCSTGASTGTATFGWTTSLGTVSTLFGRAYIAMDPGASTSDAVIRFQSGATFGGGIQITSAGHIAIQNAASAITQTSTTTLSVGGIWARVEWQLVCGGAGVGSLVVKIYNYPSAGGAYDNPTATETLTDNTSAFGVSGSINEVLFGWNVSHANQPNLYFDDVAVSTGGFLGPSYVPATYPSFPTNPLGLAVQIYIGGGWADITSLVRAGSDISINQRGKPDESQEFNPVSLTLVLNNANGAFCPNNTASPFYPFILQNTVMRVGVFAQSATGVVYAGYRFYGDVRKWPPSWDPTGNDNWVSVTANGIFTRYIQGSHVGSTIRRWYTTKTKTTAQSSLYPIAYWPCEELTGSSSFANLIPTGSTMTWTGTPQLSSDSSMPGSDPIPQINGSTWTGNTGSYSVQGPVSFTVPGKYQWQCPGTVTSLTTVESWGGGGGGSGGLIHVAGAGGEYAKDTSSAVTPGNVYNVVVGAPGDGGRESQNQPTYGKAGGNSYFAADAVTTLAHGGGAATPTGFFSRGGTGSASATKFSGGAGGTGTANGGGGGGGGSGGTASNGNAGGNTVTKTGGTGATAVTGGGKGGNGETFQEPGTYTHGLPWEYIIRAPAPGGAPGGGGGSGSSQNTYGPFYGPGVPGGPGKVTINFTGSTVPFYVVLRFVVDVPSSGMPDGAILARAIVGSGTLAKIEAYYVASANGIGFRGYNSVPTLIFDTGTAGTAILAGNGACMCSLEMKTTGGGTTVFCALDFRFPTDGGSLATYPFTSFTGTIGTISQVIINPNGTVQDTALGQIVLQYAYESLFSMTQTLNSQAGEIYLDRFKRVCQEEGVVSVVESEGFWSFDETTAYLNNYTAINFDNWYATNAILDLYPEWASFGTNSLMVCGNTVSAGPIANSPQVPIQAGQYTSVWADVNTLGQGQTYTIKVTFYDTTGAALSNKTQNFVISTPFYVGTLNLSQLLAPANTTSMDVQILISAVPSFVGEQFAIDNVSIGVGVRMGPQPDDTLIDILQQVEDADRGILIEPRDFYGAKYRSRVNLMNQDPQLTLSYASAHLAQVLQPTFDEQLIRNNVTVTRINGGSVNIQATTGPLSVQAPPVGVGDYNFSASVNLFADSQLLACGSWILNVGTVNDFRYPAIVVDLARTAGTSLFASVPAVDGGDHIQITGAPSPPLPSSTVDELAFGFTETLNNYKWVLEYNAVPALPYDTNVDTSGDFWNTGSIGSWTATGGTLTVGTGLNAPYGHYLQHVTSSTGQQVQGGSFTVTPSTSYTLFWAFKATAGNQIEFGMFAVSATTITFAGPKWAYGSTVITTGSSQTVATLIAQAVTAAPVTFQIGYFICIPTSEVLNW